MNGCANVQAWLGQHVSGYDVLSQEEKDAIMHFALLWSLFEAKVLENQASASSIQRVVVQWSDSKCLRKDDFEVFIDYFSDRYIANGIPNTKFEILNLRQNNKPELVKAVLKRERNNLQDIVTALLIVVFRYRNNFFHGMKWAYDFSGQLNNFTMANTLLMKVMEINDNCERCR